MASKKGDKLSDEIRKYFSQETDEKDSCLDWRAGRRSRFLCRGCGKDTLVMPGFPPSVCSYCKGRDFSYMGGWYV